MPEEYVNEFYVLLRSFREQRQELRRWGMKWDQSAVAKRLGVSRMAYINWENGQLPTRIHLKKIVSIFYLDEKEERALYRAAAEVRPDIENLPFTPNPFFTGRKSYLKQLVHFFHESGSVVPKQPIVISISGLAGIGKTQLALAYAYHCYPNIYRAVLWVNAADERTLETSYGSLAQTLDLPEKDEQKLGLRVKAVRQWLADHTNWLLIMDNADHLELARDFFPRGHHGHILLTTRSPFAGKIGARHIELSKMKPAEGRHFLLHRSLVIQDKAKLDTVGDSDLQLVKLLDGHPLALDQAGAYIQETDGSFTEYINLYNKQRRLFLAKRRALEERQSEPPEYSQHPDTVVVTFNLCFAMACEHHRLADELLNFCAFLQPDDIPEELFQNDDNFKVDRDTYNGGIAALRRYSLIKRNTQEMTLSMHRLVQAVLIDDMPPDLQRHWRERILHALDTSFEPTLNDWKLRDRLVPHITVGFKWSKDNQVIGIVGTLIEASLFQKAGMHVFLRGNYQLAEVFLELSYLIYKHHLGAEHTDVASVLFNLATLSILQDMDGRAEYLLQQALAIQKNKLGADHPDTIRSLSMLAAVYFRQGEFEKAEPLMRQVLSIQENELGLEHPGTAYIIFNYALLCIEQDKYEMAELLLQQLYKIAVKSQETEYYALILLLYGSAMLLYAQGDHKQAAKLSQQANHIMESTLGADHPQVLKLKEVYTAFNIWYTTSDRGCSPESNDEPSI